MKYIRILITIIIILVTSKIFISQVLDTHKDSGQEFVVTQSANAIPTNCDQHNYQFSSTASAHLYKEARIDFSNSFYAFRTQWQQNQQRISENVLQYMKRCITHQALYCHQLINSQYFLFNNFHTFSSGKPCSDYYIYAMRRILI